MSKLLKKYREIRSRNLFLRVVLNKYFIVTLFFLVIVLFVDRNSAVVWFRCRKTLRDQKKEQAYYRNAIEETETKIEQLQSNRDTLEMFARENYYFLEDGEDVFIVEPASKE